MGDSLKILIGKNWTMSLYLDFAKELAFEAGEIIRKNFALGMKKTWKEDKTPLTVTDQQINDLVIKRISARLPEHIVIYETLYSATYASALTAAGEFVAEIYGSHHPWDGAAAKIIVEEAGGKVTDLAGAEQRYDGDINGFVVSNGILHQEILETIALAKKIGQKEKRQ